MRGHAPVIKDIELDFHDLVLPANILAPEESLSLDEEPEEEPKEPYKVDTYCGICKTGVRVFIVATGASVRTLQQLLLCELAFVCIECYRTRLHHGGS
uniref:Protein E7 n=1 Tax=Human papillomavirus TaxID=10566 RepID=H2BQC9_9PAPI|nr:E7 protein [Human papillomavirus]